MIRINKDICCSDSKFYICDSCKDHIGAGNEMHWLCFGEIDEINTFILCKKCLVELRDKLNE